MSDRAYFYLGRALPLLVFGFLLAIQAQLAYAGVETALSGALDRSQSMYLVNRVLTVAFFGFLLVIYMLRGKARKWDHKPVPVIAAVTGSFVLYTLFLFPGQTRSQDLRVLGLSDIFLAAGMLWALYSLSYLRNRFSIVPEARELVTTGPYRVVRHPVYLGEIIAGLGLVLPTLLSLHAIVLAVFLSAQLLRTQFEEQVLRDAFPEYGAYARQTRRLIPFVL
jgi:protein-S-isoprenylcysteine O-methyltransferase Ste14